MTCRLLRTLSHFAALLAAAVALLSAPVLLALACRAQASTNLHGKRDLVPGRDTVVGESGDEFEAWRRARRLPAREPVHHGARRGRDVFLSLPCIMCHRQRSRHALGSAGPGPTRVRSRLTPAPGTIPVTPDPVS